MHYVYVLTCADDTLYTGYTTDVERRVREHNDGDGARYTSGRRPVELKHVERFDDRGEALSREHEIKSMTRAEKATLITGDSGMENGELGQDRP
ncbi:MAG: GIY-YIG nuclease family protein [Halodesulfurarchaeum sp.]